MLEILIFVVMNRQSQSTFSQFMNEFVSLLKPMAWFGGLMLLAMTIIPWYALAGYFYGWDFIRAVFVYQNFERYLTGFDHLHPWWYYSKSIFGGMFPASLLVPVGIWVALQRLQRLPERLMLSWAGFTLMFFSISASKQGKYILPAAPAFLALGILGVGLVFKMSLDRALMWCRRWAVTVISIWAALVVLILPFYSPCIANVSDYTSIRKAVSDRPGNLVYYQWPRSIVLYELGYPMDFVRSSRELYRKIKEDKIKSGDYLLVAETYLPGADKSTQPEHLIPAPERPWFEHVLGVKAEKNLQLFRVLPGAKLLDAPITPEPEELNWRDARFDTD